MDEIDIWRAANVLIRQRGDKATLRAAERVRTLLANGDAAGTLVSLPLIAKELH